MTLLKKMCEKIILIIITISILIMFCATPASYAKLDLKDGEFYYAGTTKGTYTVKDGIFSWLLDNIGQIADWLLGIITMGFRMVFVGWTALLEKLLTWALETTAGVNVAGKEIDGMSSTDLTSITDSSGNVTVQAIVYNQVPAFDINFFNNKYDKTVSGTGMKYKCDKCDKNSEECCSETGCSCECKGNCDGCKKYLAALAIDQENNPPIVVQIKDLVATWYYVMRFLSVAAMLVVLIGIGIKMAISTIASEKAVYKRMLVDWVIGIIILFSIHYLMIFIIHINEYLVESIKNAANEVNTIEMKQLSGTDDKIKKTNEDIEIDVYEATRTRAYDAKLSNGLTGMIMYMTLVYFAIRYSIVYVKRYLTLIVLTLMGPPVGVAYALQKVFSGKSSTLKTWMTEYTMNVIIQTVHAIIYGVFISTALVLSLESVAGTIVALILMNYGLKAEKTFRKIFKMGESDSLLGHTADAGDAENMKKNLDMMAGLYVGAKPAAKALMNTPYAKALKGVGKIGAVGVGGLAAGGVKIGRAAKDKFGDPRREEKKYEKAIEKEMDKNGEGYARKENESDEQYESRRDEAKARLNGFIPVKQLIEYGNLPIKENLLEAGKVLNDPNATPEQRAEAQEKFDNAIDSYNKLKDVSISDKEIARAHGQRTIDMENTFTVGKGYSRIENIGNIATGIFGTKHKDLKTGKYVSDHNGYYENLKLSDLLGLTDADKKVLKEQVFMPMRNGLGGMMAMFVGMGTIVAHPGLGMGLLTSGANFTAKTFRKPMNDRKYKGRYGAARFGTPTMRKMEKEAVKRANKEWDQLVVNNIKNNHTELYDGIKKDLAFEKKLSWKDNFVKDLKSAGLATVGVGTLGLISGGGIAVAPLAAVAGAGFMARRFIGHTGLSSNMDAINLHAAKQFKQQQLQFIEDSLNIQGTVANAQLKNKAEQQEKEYMVEEFKKLGFKYDPNTGELEVIEEWRPNNPDKKQEKEDEAKRQFDVVMMELYAAQNMEYDIRTGLPTPKEGIYTQNENSKNEDLDELKQVMNSTDKVISDNDIKIIDRAIDQVILEALKDDKNFDIDNKQMQNKIIDEISQSVKDILGDKKIDELFKDQKKDFGSVLKKRSSELENKNPLIGLSDEEKISIQVSINELAEGQKDFSEVKYDDVLKKLGFSDGSQKPSTSDGSKTVDTKSDGSARVETAVKTYVEAVQNSKMIEPPKRIERTTRKNAKEKVQKSIENRRKKIEDILSSDLDYYDEKLVKETVDQKNYIESDGKVSSSEVLDLLFIKKELETINDYGAKELELKKGVKDYKEAVKKKTKAAMEYYGAELRVKTFERDYAIYYGKDGNPKPVSEIGNDQIVKEMKEIKDIKSSLEDLKAKKENAEKILKTKGPIVDVNQSVKKLFDTSDKK